MRTKRFLILLVVCGIMLLPLFVFAQSDIEQIGNTTGLSTDLPQVIGRIIQVILGTLGVIILVLMIYAGYLWMTAGGDDTQVLKAKNTMIRAIIGFVIVLISFSLTTFIMNLLGGGAFGGGRNDGNTGPGIPPFSNSLGNGGIIDHYPARDQIDVPRNTRIIVTFKGIVSPEQLIDGYDDANTPGDMTDDTIPENTPLLRRAVSIYRTDEGDGEAFASDQVRVNASIIDTNDIETSTYVFSTPVLDGEVQYSVELDDSIEDSNGNRMVDRGGYMWSFTTSNDLDITPPKVESVQPVSGRTYGRNIAIQATFNEAMDPTSVSGLYTALANDGKEFTNIVVSDAGGAIEGVFALSNGYRTITYLTFDACGTNSCGQTLYCLPSNERISTLIKSPRPDAPGSPFVSEYPPFGATDIVGNALDGSGDGIVTADTDNYTWAFSTNNEIVLAGPRIETILPTLESPNEVVLDTPVRLAFNDILLASSVIAGNIFFAPSPLHDMWFTTRLEVVDDVKHTVQLPHGVFAESTEDVTYVYNVLAVEGLKNQYQNCFVPAEGPGKDAPKCTPTADQPYCCDGVLSANACITRP